ncbi:MAG: hypothetical protein IIA81_03245 [Thaumarchaeota archaeon]|nr:hypothetical protein [Nitrososphaerota archaeon]
MVFSFKVIRLDINQSYFFGQVQYKNREFKINIQNEMRGKILKLPFGFVPKKERMIVRFTGQDDLFVEDYMAYGGESEWLEINSDEITYFLADRQDQFDTLEIIDE